MVGYVVLRILTANMKIKSATRPRCALLVVGMKKHIPAANRVQAICGKVNRRRERRPKVSIVPELWLVLNRIFDRTGVLTDRGPREEEVDKAESLRYLVSLKTRGLYVPGFLTHDARRAPVVDAPALTKTVELYCILRVVSENSVNR